MLPPPTVSFMQKLAARKAPEVELYQQLGFPDSFTDGEWLLDMEGSPPMEVQYLWYGPRECELVLKGSRVLGHPHEVRTPDVDEVEWDGVARPRTFHEYRSHVQSLAPSIPKRSPLGQALEDFRPTDWRNQSLRWRRLVDWWAMSRTAGDKDLAPLLKRALEQMGALTTLRLAAELVSPGFARRTLVAAGHWPSSRLGVTKARIEEALPTGYPERYRVYSRATGEHLGPMYSVRPLVCSELREEDSFSEEDRATCWPLSASGYAITGDGDIVRRDRWRWLRLGPAREALLIRPPKAERRKQG